MRAMREARERATVGDAAARTEAAVSAIAAIARARIPLESTVINAVLDRTLRDRTLSAIEEAGVAVRAAMDAGLLPKSDVDTMQPATVKRLYEEIVQAIESAMRENDPKA